MAELFPCPRDGRFFDGKIGRDSPLPRPVDLAFVIVRWFAAMDVIVQPWEIARLSLERARSDRSRSAPPRLRVRNATSPPTGGLLDVRGRHDARGAINLLPSIQIK